MKNYILILSLLAYCLFSCEKVVDIDVPVEDPKMVINGYLNPDSSFLVQVSKSKFVLDPAPARSITDARLSVYEGDKKLGNLQHQEEGIYLLEGIKPQAGKSYTLKAEHEKYGTVSASEQALSKITPSQVKIEKKENEEEWSSGYTYRFTFELQDPAGEKNYYLIKAMKKGTRTYFNYQTNEEEVHHYQDDLWLESPDTSLEPFCYGGCSMLISDTYFDGKSYEIKMSGNGYSWGDEETEEIFLLVYHVSEAAYLYHKTLDKSHSAQGDPFAEPVRVFTNIHGGYGVWVSVAGTSIKADL